MQTSSNFDPTVAKIVSFRVVRIAFAMNFIIIT